VPPRSSRCLLYYVIPKAIKVAVSSSSRRRKLLSGPRISSRIIPTLYTRYRTLRPPKEYRIVLDNRKYSEYITSSTKIKYNLVISKVEYTFTATRIIPYYNLSSCD
jgi:hypothetical protein